MTPRRLLKDLKEVDDYIDIRISLYERKKDLSLPF